MYGRRHEHRRFERSPSYGSDWSEDDGYRHRYRDRHDHHDRRNDVHADRDGTLLKFRDQAGHKVMSLVIKQEGGGNDRLVQFQDKFGIPIYSMPVIAQQHNVRHHTDVEFHRQDQKNALLRNAGDDFRIMRKDNGDPPTNAFDIHLRP